VRDEKGKDRWGDLLALQARDPQVRVEHEVIVADRPTVAHILDLQEKRGCDLIVMGTHGHSWLKQRLVGSRTEEVIRHAPRAANRAQTFWSIPSYVAKMTWYPSASLPLPHRYGLAGTCLPHLRYR
jgi:hypothetical protein